MAENFGISKVILDLPKSEQDKWIKDREKRHPECDWKGRLEEMKNVKRSRKKSETD